MNRRHEVVGVPQHQVVLPSDQGVEYKGNEAVSEGSVANLPDWGSRHFDGVLGLPWSRYVP